MLWWGNKLERVRLHRTRPGFGLSVVTCLLLFFLVGQSLACCHAILSGCMHTWSCSDGSLLPACCASPSLAVARCCAAMLPRQVGAVGWHCQCCADNVHHTWQGALDTETQVGGLCAGGARIRIAHGASSLQQAGWGGLKHSGGWAVCCLGKVGGVFCEDGSHCSQLGGVVVGCTLGCTQLDLAALLTLLLLDAIDWFMGVRLRMNSTHLST